MKIFTIVTILILSSFYADAADIKFNGNIIEFSGEIKKGDYDNYLNLIVNHQSIPITVYLDSPGGDVSEAISIGKMMRKSLSQSIINKNGQCNSACFLIWASAVRRFPSQSSIDFNGYIGKIGLHRPFYEHSAYSELNTTKAKEEYKKLEAYVKSYLNEINIPSDIVEIMFRMKSTDAYFIIDTDLIEKIGQEAPFFEEWLIAKCGELTEKESIDAAIMTGASYMQIKGDKIPKAAATTLASMSDGYKDYLRKKNVTINTCSMNAVKIEQKRVLNELLTLLNK
jgi:hypothetical protein